MTKSPSFPHRALEQHYGINLLSVDAFEREKEILKRAAAIGVNRVMLGETWPDLGVRLVDYHHTLSELATSEMTVDAARRREVFGQIAAEAQSLRYAVADDRPRRRANRRVRQCPIDARFLADQRLRQRSLLRRRFAKQRGAHDDLALWVEL